MFLPRRWIDASPEKIKVMENTFDLIFGSLKWPCLGRAIAAIELNKGIVEVCFVVILFFWGFDRIADVGSC